MISKVVIVGVGLIGGSIAKALRERYPTLTLVGVDREPVLQAEAVHRLFSETRLADSTAVNGLDGTGLVVLAMPARTIAACVGTWLELGCPVMDCGSTKQWIIQAASAAPRREWFVPSHPMAGRERGGFENSRADLFARRQWIVCPSGVQPSAIEAARWLVDVVGGIWTEMTALEHDDAVAFTSHLPQLIASWLAANVSDAQRCAVGPAFRDMTRVAGGPDAIWRDILATNAGPIGDAARRLSEDFATLAEALAKTESGVDEALKLLARARQEPRG